MTFHQGRSFDATRRDRPGRQLHGLGGMRTSLLDKCVRRSPRDGRQYGLVLFRGPNGQRPGITPPRPRVYRFPDHAHGEGALTADVEMTLRSRHSYLPQTAGRNGVWAATAIRFR